MHHRTLRRMGLPGAVTLLALVMTACAGQGTGWSLRSPASSGPDGSSARVTTGGPSQASASTRTMKKVSVGVIPILDVAPLYLGMEKGIFARHGLQVSPQPALAGSATVPAVLAGEDQFAFSNIVTLLWGRERGAPLIAVASGASSTGDPAKDFNAVVTTYTKITPDVVGRLVLPAWPTALDPQSARVVGKAAQRFGTLKNAPDVQGLLGEPG